MFDKTAYMQIYLKKWREDNKGYPREYYLKTKHSILLYYSNSTMKCACCGESHYEFLTIDHINGEGNKHVKKLGGMYMFYLWLIKNNFPEGFQVLCYNCNLSKRTHKHCVHKENHENNSVHFSTAYRRKYKYKAIFYYSGGEMKCICCGETIYEFLSIDHINGGGNKHRKEIRKNIGEWLIKNNYPSGYRVLCHNCNSSLGHNHYCPHHPEGVPIPIIPREEDTYNKVDESIFA